MGFIAAIGASGEWDASVERQQIIVVHVIGFFRNRSERSELRLRCSMYSFVHFRSAPRLNLGPLATVSKKQIADYSFIGLRILSLNLNSQVVESYLLPSFSVP